MAQEKNFSTPESSSPPDVCLTSSLLAVFHEDFLHYCGTGDPAGRVQESLRDSGNSGCSSTQDVGLFQRDRMAHRARSGLASLCFLYLLRESYEQTVLTLPSTNVCTEYFQSTLKVRTEYGPQERPLSQRVSLFAFGPGVGHVTICLHCQL